VKTKRVNFFETQCISRIDRGLQPCLGGILFFFSFRRILTYRSLYNWFLTVLTYTFKSSYSQWNRFFGHFTLTGFTFLLSIRYFFWLVQYSYR